MTEREYSQNFLCNSETRYVSQADNIMWGSYDTPLSPNHTEIYWAITPINRETANVGSFISVTTPTPTPKLSPEPSATFAPTPEQSPYPSRTLNPTPKQSTFSVNTLTKVEDNSESANNSENTGAIVGGVLAAIAFIAIIAIAILIVYLTRKEKDDQTKETNNEVSYSSYTSSSHSYKTITFKKNKATSSESDDDYIFQL